MVYNTNNNGDNCYKRPSTQHWRPTINPLSSTQSLWNIFL